eukprot:8169760-Lingulodinium_polyedra.AAC.1
MAAGRPVTSPACVFSTRSPFPGRGGCIVGLRKLPPVGEQLHAATTATNEQLEQRGEAARPLAESA